MTSLLLPGVMIPGVHVTLCPDGLCLAACGHVTIRNSFYLETHFIVTFCCIKINLSDKEI
jgi:hypothetical protein